MTVAVLLCTYFGKNHILQQLESIAQQSYQDWKLFVSDDGSTDGTLEIVQSFAERHPGQVEVFGGPRSGFAANFFSLIARDEVTGDHFAFCDQDDEWMREKLSRAVEALSGIGIGRPAAYGSKSELIDASGSHLGYSRTFVKGASFSNALVQNIVSGNTLVLNLRAMQLLRSATSVSVSAHDWWAYLLVTGNGGEFIYDSTPTIRYRQHVGNLYGENVSLKAKWARLSGVLGGRFKKWNSENLSALKEHDALLDNESRHQVGLFEAARHGVMPIRLYRLYRSGVYRQTWDGNVGLFVAALLNRL